MIYFITLDKGMKQSTIQRKIKGSRLIDKYLHDDNVIIVLECETLFYPDKASVERHLESSDYSSLTDTMLVYIEVDGNELEQIGKVYEEIKKVEMKWNKYISCYTYTNKESRLVIIAHIGVLDLSDYKVTLKLLEGMQNVSGISRLYR